ncbi:hypothetical protein [Pseudaestuariivita sp.]|uniref:hypothetical protein n=1 Tax=Pseudaestuariivita sp. TaxID=2211669 RepID=UPI004059DF1D
MKRSLFITCAALLPSLGVAESRPAWLPEVCQPLVTVEKNSCIAVTHATCDDEYRTYEFEDAELRLVGRYTLDGDLIAAESYDAEMPSIGAEAQTAFSFEALRSGGTSTGAGALEMVISPGFPPARGTYTMTAAKTGGTTTIDGAAYLQVDVRFSMDFMGSEVEIAGQAAWLEAQGILVYGSFASIGPDAAPEVSDEEIRALHFPGDALFLTSQSAFGCGTDASMPIPQSGSHG